MIIILALQKSSVFLRLLQENLPTILWPDNGWIDERSWEDKYLGLEDKNFVFFFRLFIYIYNSRQGTNPSKKNFFEENSQKAKFIEEKKRATRKIEE